MPALNSKCPECGAPVTRCWVTAFVQYILVDGQWEEGYYSEDTGDMASFHCDECDHDWEGWATEE